MNYTSSLNFSLKGFLLSLVDIIPKLIYFIFAAISSGIDAMQALIRKLAGLDTYYQASTGEAITNRDPLSEFVYGILGIGDSAYVYKGLNTVFWSLAIFALIVLAVTTLIAILKSHYNEDSESTNPWKYIYTAIKSILTFAIIPFAVVIGMGLATFVLKTLDNITAGSANEEAIIGTYGSNAASSVFKSQQIAGTDNKTYASYDMFGAGSPSNSSTFGGMLFKASTYTANRARSGDISYSNYQEVTDGSGNQIFGASDCSAYSSLQTSDEKREYIAMQIDYAFSNCLVMKEGASFDGTIDVVGKDDLHAYVMLFRFGKNTISSFSKWNVEVVWMFYNLWSFNFIVAFGGGIAMFGILISIIIGMMTRLIKGAALFMIYPPLLSLAPLDNFKAFKTWVTNFMQQILMAIGTIVGINLLLLLLPYIQNIQFFGIGIIDAIINMIILLAGLMMAKDFISIVSGMIGSVDAAGAGESLKASIAGGFKRGVGITGKAGASIVKGGHRFNTAVVRAGVGGIKKVAHATTAAKNSRLANGKLTKGEEKRKTKATKSREKYDEKFATARSKQGELKVEYLKAATGLADPLSDAVKKAGEKAFNKAKASGGSDAEAYKAKQDAELKGFLKEKGKWSDYKKEITNANSATKGRAKFEKALDEFDIDKREKKWGFRRYETRDGKQAFASTYKFWDAFAHGRQKKDKDGNPMVDKDGKPIMTKSALGDLKNVGKTMADGFLKVMHEEVGKGIGMDKMIDGSKDIFKGMWYTKWVSKKAEAKSGDALQADISKAREAESKKQLETLEKISTSMDGVAKATQANLAETKKLRQQMGSRSSSGDSSTPPSGSGR